MSFSIRPAQQSDADSIFALLTQFAVSYAPERTAFDGLFPRTLASEQATLLVAEQNETIVGYALSLQLLVLYANAPITELQELMVAPESRSQGIGRALVEATIASAQAIGSVEVTVPSRRAGNYYLKLGFAETATYYKHKLKPSAMPGVGEST